MSKVYDVLHKGVWQTSKVVNYMATFFLVIMVLPVVVDVFLRWAFNSPLTVSYDFILLLMVCVVYFAVAHTAVLKGHIVIDVASSRMPKRVRSITEPIAHCITIAVCGLIAWQSVAQAMIVQRQGQGAGYAIQLVPLYPFLLIVFFGATLMGLVFLFHLIDFLIRKPEVGEAEKGGTEL